MQLNIRPPHVLITNLHLATVIALMQEVRLCITALNYVRDVIV